jgi:hypothetical protein
MEAVAHANRSCAGSYPSATSIGRGRSAVCESRNVLRPGQYGKVRAMIREQQNAMLIPRPP